MSNLSQRWEQFRPSKALWVWSCIGCVIATMVVGFTFGGWVTGGTANEMTANARNDARAELVANLCVNKFVSAANAEQQLAQLKEARSWERDDFINDGGWLKISGLESDAPGAGDLCADQLLAMEQIPASAAQGATAAASESVGG